MNDSNFYTIGLSGLAGAGKDLFYSLLSEEMEIERFALADQLKSELRPRIFHETGVDVLDCSHGEKNSVRGLLVEYAKEKREGSNGRHWIRKLNLKMLPLQQSACITDIRYDDYDRDEVYWLKHELGGLLVHISKYQLINNNKKLFFEAPNEEERRNDPKLKAKSDYIVEWPALESHTEDARERLKPYASKFAKWLRREASERRIISEPSQG